MPSVTILIWSTPPSTAHCPVSPEGFWRKRGTQHQAIGRSPGGLTTKMVALVEALGHPMGFLLLAGQTHDSKGAMPPIKTVPCGPLLADEALDTDWLLTELDGRGA